MSTPVEDFLEHYGVKGMKWGHRKSAPSTKQQIAKADKKFEKSTKLSSTEQKVFEAGIKSWNTSPAFKAINSKPRYAAQGKGFKYGLTSDRALYKSYNADMGRAFAKHLNEHASKAGKNASGTRQYGVQLQYMSDTKWKVITRPVKHADDDLVVELVRDDKGFIIEFKMVEPLTHADVDEFLAHYGIKGMKWGRRKGDASSDSAKSTSVRTSAKKSGVQSVSNKDLRAAIERMRLEQDFKRLSVNEKSPVTRWISSTLLEVGKREVQAQAAKTAAKVVAKKVATGGVG